MTSWIWGLDPRFTMAAPSCFITTFERNLENEIPADAEQYPPGVLGCGMEMSDLLLGCNFPKPLLLCGQRHCFFDRRGLEQAYADLNQLYTLVGKPDGVDLFIGENDHGFHPDAQQAVAEFFCKHAGLSPPPFTEAGWTFEPLSADALEVCPGGQVIGYCKNATPVHETLGLAAQGLAATRPSLSPAQLCEELRKLLTVPEALPGDTSYRVLRTGMQVDLPGLPQHTIGRYAVHSETGIEVILHKPIADGHTGSLDVGGSGDGSSSTHLHVPDLCAAEDLGSSEVLDWLGWGGEGAAALTARRALYVVECRGLGESWPEGPASLLTSGVDGAAGSGFTTDGRHPRWASCGMDYMYHGHALLFGESYLGQRVFDLLRTSCGRCSFWLRMGPPHSRSLCPGEAQDHWLRCLRRC